MMDKPIFRFTCPSINIEAGECLVTKFMLVKDADGKLIGAAAAMYKGGTVKQLISGMTKQLNDYPTLRRL